MPVKEDAVHCSEYVRAAGLALCDSADASRVVNVSQCVFILCRTYTFPGLRNCPPGCRPKQIVHLLPREPRQRESPEIGQHSKVILLLELCGPSHSCPLKADKKRLLSASCVALGVKERATSCLFWSLF